MPKNITLIGFSGCGKSTVGPALARKLRMRFYDTDAILEERFGMPIVQVFAERGEKSFRQSESELIASAMAKSEDGLVIALGGGAFEDSGSRRLIRESSTVVYLSCSQRELYRRLKDQTDRPLVGGATGHAIRSDIKNLLQRRRPHYLMADLVVSTTNRTVEETVNEITRKLTTIHGSNKSTT